MTFGSNAIGDEAGWLASWWDWDEIYRRYGKNPFPRGMSPSDIDYVLEAGGRLLFIEAKKAGVEIRKGQRLLLESLADNPKAVVIVIRAAMRDHVPQEPIEWCRVPGWKWGTGSLIEFVRDLEGIVADFERLAREDFDKWKRTRR